MKRFVAAMILLSASLAAAQISPQFFAMHINRNTDPWPSTVGVQFSSWRSVASEVKWSDINTAPGVYDWTNLDKWLSFTAANGQTVLYTFYFTPSWASQCPSCTCNSGNEPPGGCYPPNDLNSDGTGTDQHVKDFITALMQHEGPGKIQYIEIWNEPNIPAEYGGTVAQLVSMARDVRQIAQSYDPNIKITSPPETGDGKGATKMLYLGAFLSAGGGQYVDVIGLHGYVQNPEDLITRINATLPRWRNTDRWANLSTSPKAAGANQALATQFLCRLTNSRDSLSATICRCCPRRCRGFTSLTTIRPRKAICGARTRA